MVRRARKPHWVVIGAMGSWWVVTKGYIPTTAGDMGQGTILAWSYKTRASARISAKVMNYERKEDAA